MDLAITYAPIPETANPLPSGTGLAPFEGEWSYEKAAHLLRRATFSPADAQIKSSVAKGLAGTMQELFKELPLPNPPVNYYFTQDPNVPVGSTWVTAPNVATVNVTGPRNRSLVGWTMLQVFQEKTSIREKLTLFWHNHFATNNDNNNDPRFKYIHIQLLRQFAWGNFKELVKKITVDPSMLRFLNGNQNTNRAPNENYARELLELFTIGKGPLAGPGDYTNYTEEDILQIAKVLTGWRDRGYNSVNPDVVLESYYTSSRHDKTLKTLSHRFNAVSIPNMEDKEYEHLVDIIFQQEEVARFICRKLYRWFVYYHISDEVETNVIEPMAQLLIDAGYEIKPALQALLSSEHFFDILNVGPMIKNPIDFITSTIKPFAVNFTDDYTKQYTIAFQLHNAAGVMQMQYFNPPDVAGWKAFYQEPLYYRTWINAATLPPRMAFTKTLTNNGYNYAGTRVKIEVLSFLKTVDNALNPVEMIKNIAKVLMPQPLSDSQISYLLEILLPGLPEYEWTLEYEDHLLHPEDTNLAKSVESKLRALLDAMTSLPEFYLS